MLSNYKNATFMFIFFNLLFGVNSFSQTIFEVKFRVKDEAITKINSCLDLKTNAILKLNNNSLFLKSGFYDLEFSSDSYLKNNINFYLRTDTLIILELVKRTSFLDEVIVNGQIQNKISEVQNGRERISESDLSKIPSLFGEKDIIKSFQLLPGINSSSEGAADLNVRGGSSDQNLFLLDGNKIYNPSHFLGLISTYNSSIVKYADIYKTGFPAKFGGKISSVLDVKTIIPNFEKLESNINLGLISSSIFVNSPLKKGKSAFILSGRRSIIDLFMRLDNSSNEQYKFNDIFGKYVNLINGRTRFEINFFKDLDVSSFTKKDGNLKENYIRSSVSKSQLFFSSKFIKIKERHSYDISFFFSKYDLDIREENFLINPEYLIIKSDNSVKEIGIKYNQKIKLNESNDLNFGLDLTLSEFNTGKLETNNSGQISTSRSLSALNPLQYNFYAENDFQVTQNIQIRTGIRFDNYKTSNSSVFYVEPRVNFSYKIDPTFSIKSSYNKVFQPVQTLINNGLGLPIDLLVSADGYIKPQTANQYSVGFYKNIEISKNTLNFSVESYLNNQSNIISYKDGFDSRSFTIGSILNVDNWQDGVAIGKGKSYGLEFLIEKKDDNSQGWVSYTLSKVTHSFSELDNGKSFYPRQDRRHVFNLYHYLKLRNNWGFSYIFNFSSGQAITLPNSVVNSSNFIYPNGKILNRSVLIFTQGERGAERIKSFHKLDISFKKSLIFLKRYESTIDLGIYNLYNRRNAYFYTLGIKEDGVNELAVIQSVSLLPIIPYFSFKVKL